MTAADSQQDSIEQVIAELRAWARGECVLHQEFEEICARLAALAAQQQAEREMLQNNIEALERSMSEVAAAFDERNEACAAAERELEALEIVRGLHRGACQELQLANAATLRERERAEAAERKLAGLIAASKQATKSDGGLRYESDDDDIGSHACCLVLSYKEHAADCWVPKLRAAIDAAREQARHG